MENFRSDKSIQNNDQNINEDLKRNETEYKSNAVESLRNKTDKIISYEFNLNTINQKSQSPIKLQFYEDKTPEIEELEKIKEEVDREFRNISNPYQNDQTFNILLQNDDTINSAYMKYAEVYNNFSYKLREVIGNLISESFSPYIYQDSKILYSMIYQSELIEYDIDEFQQRSVKIDLNMNLAYDEVMVAQLPNNELFCSGKNNKIRYSWIIDLNSYSLKRVLPSIRFLYRSGIFYYQQNVYIFGGLHFPYIKRNPFSIRTFALKKILIINLI